MRKILLLLLLLAVSASAPANVSLGEIEVRSFLNQPLKAQFRADGSAVASEEVEFRVASEEAYRRAGLQRAAVPADLTIVVEGTGASRVVRLTTENPVHEPYLGLLLEVRWPAGRVLREFAVLLDPPVAFAQDRSAAPVISRAPGQQRARDLPFVRDDRLVPTATYIVRPGDTLYLIAQRLGYSDATPQQVMLAIRDANPQAFIGRNINQLLGGAELRLPEEAEVTAYSRREALLEVQRQIAEWQGRAATPSLLAAASDRPVPEVLAETTPAAAAPSRLDAHTEVEAPSRAEVAPTAEQDAPTADAGNLVADSVPDLAPIAVDQLEILEVDAFEPTMVASASNRLIEEALLSQQAAVSELWDELSALRVELGERDQLVRVMNAELAQLQESLRVLQEQDERVQAQQEQDERAQAQQEQEERAQAQREQDERAQAQREQSSEGLFGGGFDITALRARLLADPLLLLLAATSVLLFLLLVVSLFRPRRYEVSSEALAAEAAGGGAVETTPAPDSPDRGPAAAAVSPTVAAATAGTGVAGAAGVVQESPRRAGSSGHDDPGIEVNAAGVLADVDMYLAYGMNDQAIKTLENAIRDGHDHPDFRVRLIEAYAANDDGDAVRREVEAVRDQLGPDQHALRERVGKAEARFAISDDVDSITEPGGALKLDAGGDRGSSMSSSNDADAPAGWGEAESDQDSLRFGSGGMAGEVQEEPTSANNEPEQLDASHDWILPELEPLDPSETKPLFDTGAGIDDDTSENGMKLSLAEAFLEMGDRDGALTLLEEILPSATEAQKARMAEIRRLIQGGDG